jgi:hypothetical protein
MKWNNLLPVEVLKRVKTQIKLSISPNCNCPWQITNPHTFPGRIPCSGFAPSKSGCWNRANLW